MKDSSGDLPRESGSLQVADAIMQSWVLSNGQGIAIKLGILT